MKTQLCVTCNELVPEGCCTCGDKQELKPLGTDPTFSCPACGQAFYKTADAASYLEIHLSTFKYHFHAAHNVRPLVDVDRRLALFTKQQLDEFKADRRPRGRPRKEQVK